MSFWGFMRKKRKTGYIKKVPDITVSELISSLLHYQGQQTVKVCTEHGDESYQISGIQERDGQLFFTFRKLQNQSKKTGEKK